MKGLVIYDSVFGNTETIAKGIVDALSHSGDIELKQVKDVRYEDFKNVGILLVGSPTRGFRATPAILRFIKSIPANGLNGVKTGAFDTRMDENDIQSKFLLMMMKWFGYAAEPIAKILHKKGGKAALNSTGFYVQDAKGPLKEGELVRAEDWARNILQDKE